jgi:hypothetical protein
MIMLGLCDGSDEPGYAEGRLTSFAPHYVSKFTEVSPETIRTWRNRGFLPPRRENLTFVDVARIYMISQITAGGVDLATAASAAERGCRTVAFYALRHCYGTINILGSDEAATKILSALRASPDNVVLNGMDDDAPEDADLAPFMIKLMGEDSWKITSGILDLKQVVGGSGVFIDLDETAKELVRRITRVPEADKCLMEISQQGGIDLCNYVSIQVGYAGPDRDLTVGGEDAVAA